MLRSLRGEPFEMTFPLRGKDGTYKWFLTRVAPLRNSENKVVRWFGTNTDVDEHRKAREALKTAVKTRDDFLSIASHELKTPLTSLKIQVQMRKRSILKNDTAAFSMEKLRAMVEGDERHIHRLTRLIDDMLDVVRITSGKLSVHADEVDFCVLVREVAERMAEQLDHAGCVLTIHCCEPTIGYWDHFRIEQVITNLLTNAMKYGAHQPIEIWVSRSDQVVTATQGIQVTAPKVIFEIQDHGIGVDPEDHDRIFYQFERAVGRNEVSGLGLGLYIVRQILDVHGGAIHVESGKNMGARFIVELPLTQESKSIKR